MSRIDDCFEARDVLHSRFVRPYVRARLRGLAPVAALRRISEAVAAAHLIVHGVGVGKKISGDKKSRFWCVRVYVTQKLPLGLLSKAARIPESIAGIPTDIIPCAPAVLLTGASCPLNRTVAVRPMVSGISIAHYGVTSGTLACFCRSSRTGDPPDAVYALSNNHVLADLNRAGLDDPVLQPGPGFSGLLPRDHVAVLDRFESIIPPPGVNVIDAAAARIIRGAPDDLEICMVGRVAGVVEPSDELPVCKYGAKSGFTRGRIDDLGIKGPVGLNPLDPSDVAEFEDQIRVVPQDVGQVFSLGGDSGSLVIAEASRMAVGLLFGGALTGEYSLANPISTVLDKLHLTLL